MTAMTDKKAFSQADYNIMIKALDNMMEYAKEHFDLTEAEGRAWLIDFVTEHYFPVWRGDIKE